MDTHPTSKKSPAPLSLATLIAADGSGTSHHARECYQSQPWDVPLPNLKTFSIDSINANELARILDCCPALEDLEYFDGADPPPREYQYVYRINHEVLDPGRHLHRIRSTLRRLCYSVIQTRPEHPDRGEVDEEDEEDDEGQPRLNLYFSSFTTGLSFAKFPVLEQLELEQHILYGPVFPTDEDPDENRGSRLTTPHMILERLPPSLRRLRLGCIVDWPVVFRDLSALFGQTSRFPRLESVELEVFRSPPESEYWQLAEAMSACGISLSLCYVPRRFMSRGLLPARPRHPGIVLTPVRYGSLQSNVSDGLE